MLISIVVASLCSLAAKEKHTSSRPLKPCKSLNKYSQNIILDLTLLAVTICCTATRSEDIHSARHDATFCIFLINTREISLAALSIHDWLRCALQLNRSRLHHRFEHFCKRRHVPVCTSATSNEVGMQSQEANIGVISKMTLNECDIFKFFHSHHQ
jgi:hypothetical protein